MMLVTSAARPKMKVPPSCAAGSNSTSASVPGASWRAAV
jgi:hypothetical protein